MLSSYKKLHDLFVRLSHFDHLSSISKWDMYTMMPCGGIKARSEALAEINILRYKILSSKKTKKLLDQASQEDLGEVERINLFEMKRSYSNVVKIPISLIKMKNLVVYRCEHDWRIQRNNNDWKGFLKNFKEVVKVIRQEAEIRSQVNCLRPYDALLNIFEPAICSDKLNDIFDDLKVWLPSLLHKIILKQNKTLVIHPTSPFDVEKQKKLGVKVMNILGFDFNSGRIDTSFHPFCGGVPEDVRITTRYNTDEFFSSLMSVIHETGHACYEQNLPREWLNQPISFSRSTSIHESQSLLFEMQLARSIGFLKIIRSLVIEQFGYQPAFEEDNFVNLIRLVKIGLIRVSSDEVSYPIHIIIRYEIEKSLIEGDIEVDDVPVLWNEKMFSYFGLNTTKNYKDGCMQDVHWVCGYFGYFPTYIVGAMYAAQIFRYLICKNSNFISDISYIDLSFFFTWLKNNIWNNGSRYDTNTLISKAIGEKLNPCYFREHLENRYLISN